MSKGFLFGETLTTQRLENMEIPRPKKTKGIPPYEFVKQKDMKTNNKSRKIKININKYRLKYDFEVARKVNPIISGVTYHEEYQDAFNNNALMELLQECSSMISRGEKTFLSLYTIDGKFIASLNDIPADC